MVISTIMDTLAGRYTSLKLIVLPQIKLFISAVYEKRGNRFLSDDEHVILALALAKFNFNNDGY